MRTKKKSLRNPRRPVGVNEPNIPPVSWVVRMKERFTALTALVSFIAAVLGILVLYANNKGAFADLKNDFYSWLYQEKAWTGLFNNFPEGYVDMASMNLSDTSLQLVIIVNDGNVDGVIADKKLCKVGFPHGYKLLKGDIGVFGNTANVQAFDFEAGFLREYAELKIKREGIVLEVEAREGSNWLLPHPVRIAMHPETDTDTGMESLHDFCATERAELMKHLGQIQMNHGIESKLDTETP